MYKSKVNVLLIDDDSIYCYIAKALLLSTQRTETINIYHDARKALKFLELNKGNYNELPDIILLDLNMPEMDGWQFLDKYQPLTLSIQKPIHLYIATSSNNEDDKELSELFASVNGFITKPFVKEKIELALSIVPEMLST